jgi:oligogalacturonide transport system substrate-binding protein
VIALFEERNPGVKIEAEYGGWDGYREKLITQLAGGTAPDIIQIDQPWLHELSSMGDVFYTLEGVEGLDTLAFDKQFLDSYCGFDGKLKGLPSGLNGETFLANAPLLVSAKVDPYSDWTWDALFDAGKKVSALGGGSYLLAIDPALTRDFFKMYVKQLTGGFIGADKKLSFTTAEAAQALRLFKRLLDEKVLIPFNESSLYRQKPEENPDWVNGKLGMIHSWASNQERAGAGVKGLIASPLPVMPLAKDSGVRVRPSQIITVNNAGKNKALAVKFLNFFFNDPDAVEILAIVRGVPPTSTGRDILAQKNLIAPMVQEAIDISLANAGKPETVYEMNSELMDILEDCISKMAFGKSTPDEAALEIEVRLTEKLSSL